MKKPLLTLIFILITVYTTSAQIKLQAGIGGGIAIPSSEYSGSTIDYYSGTKYGLSTGYNIAGKFRVNLLPISIAGTIDYSSFSNSGESEDGKGKVDISQSIISIKVGPEYQVNIFVAPLTPYIWGNIAYNSISGETKFNGVSDVPSGNYDVKAASRFGFGLAGGVLINISPFLELDLGLQYNWVNPFGKDFEETDPNMVQRIDSYLALNDAKDPAFEPDNKEHFIENDRSINTFNITVTLMVGL
jgi:opacity protein-like surface antigen